MSGSPMPPTGLNMTRRKALGTLSAGFVALPGSAFSQGFAGLGTTAEGFALPDRDHRFAFPQDHGPHPDFRIEWWYLTGNLTAADGMAYGVQWTLFRTALAPEEAEGWDSPQVWMGHAALTTPDEHFFSERLSRGGIGTAGVRPAPFEAWIDDWSLQSVGDGGDQLSALRLVAGDNTFGYDLALEAQGPLVAQGQHGFSVKGPSGVASHYYSQPFYRVSGTVRSPVGPVTVEGNAWLDREWSSQPLEEDQAGWDWVSLHFDDGHKMMGFSLRSQSGAPFTSATWIAPDGTPAPYGDGALTMTPQGWADVGGRAVPVRWRVHLPLHGVDVTIVALRDDAWNGSVFAPYWEGPVRISGSHAGIGYLEMTGYTADPTTVSP